MAVAVLMLGACAPDDASLDVSSTPAATSMVAPVLVASTSDEVVTGVPVPVATVRPGDVSPAPSPTPERALEAVVQPDTLVTLRLGDRIAVAGTGWSVGFREVIEDSRCPVDVQCIWAGQAVVRLVGEHSDGRVAALTLTMPAGGAGSGTLGDLRIDASGIQPLPYAGAPRPSLYVYVLSLRINMLQLPVPSALSGVRGRVTIGPMCPVMQLDQPCPDRPYRALLVVRDGTGREVAQVESSDDGVYALPLPSGTYMMEPRSPSASRLPRASAQPFEVRTSAWTVLDIAFDSGIR